MTSRKDFSRIERARLFETIVTRYFVKKKVNKTNRRITKNPVGSWNDAAGIVAETNARAERLRARDDVTSGVKRTARNSTRFPFLFFSPPSRSQRAQGRDASYFSLLSTRHRLFRHCFRFPAGCSRFSRSSPPSPPRRILLIKSKERERER